MKFLQQIIPKADMSTCRSTCGGNERKSDAETKVQLLWDSEWPLRCYCIATVTPRGGYSMFSTIISIIVGAVATGAISGALVP